MNKTNESGRSMIEMLGVLAIIGVLSVGGIAGYSKAMMQFKINKSINQVSEIVANVRTLYAQQKTCEGLNISTALSMGAIPDDLSTVSGRYSVSNIFGGYIDVNCVYAGYDKPDVYTKSFSIVFEGMPKEACVALATKDWGSASSTGLTAMQVYDGDLSGYYLGSADYNCEGSGDDPSSFIQACTNGSTPTVPISPSLVSGACKCSGNYCAIAWFFN